MTQNTCNIQGKAVYGNEDPIQMPWGVLMPFSPIAGVDVKAICLDANNEIVFQSLPTRTDMFGSFVIENVPVGYNTRLFGIRCDPEDIDLNIMPQFHWMKPGHDDVAYMHGLLNSGQSYWSIPQLLRQTMNVVGGESGRVTQTDLDQLTEWITNNSFPEMWQKLVGGEQKVLTALYPSQSSIMNLNVVFGLTGHALFNKVVGMTQ